MICQFETRPRFTQYKDTQFLQLTDDWCFIVDGVRFWIPKDYFSDGASIPRPFWSIIGTPFEPDFFSAFLAHDWMYFTHCLPRSTADEVFRRFLIACGVGSIRARIMWAAVRTGGAFAWGQSAESAKELGDVMDAVALRSDRDKFEHSFQENG
jgi:hypothetical protein